MLEGAVSLVGFHRAALVTVFSPAVLPLLAFEFELLAFGVDLRERFLSGGNFRARAAQFRIRLAEALRERFQLRAQGSNLVIDTLQLNQVRNRGMHEIVILSQSYKGLVERRSADRM